MAQENIVARRGNKGKDSNGDMPQKGEKARLDEEDRRLWDFVAQTIKPLGRDSARQRPEPSATTKEDRADTGDGNRPAASAPWRDALWPGFGLKPALETPASPALPDLDRKTADRLRRGAFPMDARLDLHGLRQDEAEQRLISFLEDGWRRGFRCVLVITGKGNRLDPGGAPGVLRQALPLWFSRPPLARIILNFCPARPKDGGTGAFYVLLRRRRANPGRDARLD